MLRFLKIIKPYIHSPDKISILMHNERAWSQVHRLYSKNQVSANGFSFLDPTRARNTMV